MLNFITRKIYFIGLTKEDKHIAELLIDSFKMDFVSFLILLLVLFFPFVTALSTLLVSIFFTNLSIDNIIVGAIFVILSLFLIIFFFIKFKDEIANLKVGMQHKLYSSYLFKGNALSKKDFEEIKIKKEILYEFITEFKAQGYCYSICFDLLKILKKGKILFVAINDVDDKKANKYTMHVLYVNNDWCYDTYSQKQHPLAYALDHFYAKKYTSFSYDDIKEKSYDEFREEQSPALKVWCEQNDCFENWSDI